MYYHGSVASKYCRIQFLQILICLKDQGFTIGIAMGTIVVSLIGEIIPKSIAQSKVNALSSLLGLANFVFYLLRPITKPLLAIARHFSNICRRFARSDCLRTRSILINYIEKGLMEQIKRACCKIFFVWNQHM